MPFTLSVAITPLGSGKACRPAASGGPAAAGPVSVRPQNSVAATAASAAPDKDPKRCSVYICAPSTPPEAFLTVRTELTRERGHNLRVRVHTGILAVPPRVDDHDGRRRRERAAVCIAVCGAAPIGGAP